MTRELITSLAALGLGLGTCDPKPPATAVLSGSNPYLVYPSGESLSCDLSRAKKRVFALSLAETDAPVCLSRSLEGAHVAALFELQSCEAGQACASCLVEDPESEELPSDAACSPSDCFAEPPLVPVGSPDCWRVLRPFEEQAETHFVVLKAPRLPDDRAATPADDQLGLLPQLVIVSQPALVQIRPDALSPKFRVARLGPRIEGSAPPPGGDCDSGNCGLFPVYQPVDRGGGFFVRSAGGGSPVTVWQGGLFYF